MGRNNTTKLQVSKGGQTFLIVPKSLATLKNWKKGDFISFKEGGERALIVVKVKEGNESNGTEQTKE